MAISANYLGRIARVDRQTITRACHRGDLPPRPVEGWPDDQLPDLLGRLHAGMAAARTRSRANLALRWVRPRRRSEPIDPSTLMSLTDGWTVEPYEWCVEPCLPLPDLPPILLGNVQDE
ncbi:MAG: hypothetical protein JWM57_486 [Phycisphaerales bacterium]|nr:hypothetical protein [Phycisphaerales bacterium]